MALDLQTGAIKWGKRMQGPDTWNIGRDFAGDPTRGPDYDFGSGPNFYSLGGVSNVDMLGAGQKSGMYWSVNPATGTVNWKTTVGPGGTTGGIQWGSATDGNRIYCGLTDSLNRPYTIGGLTYTRGSWAALNAATGQILWQVPDPVPTGKAYGMVTISNGVMFAASTSGHMYAFNAATGQILWDYNAGASSICGPSVVNGTVYWGSGYGRFGGSFGTGSNKLFAFGLP